MVATVNVMNGMMGGAGGGVAVGLRMLLPTLLGLALLALVVVATVWLVRDLRSRPQLPAGHSPALRRH